MKTLFASIHLCYFSTPLGEVLHRKLQKIQTWSEAGQQTCASNLGCADYCMEGISHIRSKTFLTEGFSHHRLILRPSLLCRGPSQKGSSYSHIKCASSPPQSGPPLRPCPLRPWPSLPPLMLERPAFCPRWLMSQQQLPKPRASPRSFVAR